jgi:hypothetical protein
LTGSEELRLRLRSAFPAELYAEVSDVIAVLPADIRPTEGDVGPIVVEGESVHIPCRVYFQEVPLNALTGFTATQGILLSCLYTRHHDGFVRERHIQLLLTSTQAWIVPFSFVLVGEYVVEIIQTIKHNLSREQRSSVFYLLPPIPSSAR